MAVYSPNWVGPFKGWCLREIKDRQEWIARLEGTERLGENGRDVTEETIIELREEIASIKGAISEAESHA